MTLPDCARHLTRLRPRYVRETQMDRIKQDDTVRYRAPVSFTVKQILGIVDDHLVILTMEDRIVRLPRVQHS